MRFDIAFFLCCCRSFLSSSGRDDEEKETFYDLLGVSRKATPDELKRAYKRQSLLVHPDKLAQRGGTVTAADRDRFTRMRHAYEVLSDPRRRETYDAVGERGMRWVEEPLSVDPQELAHNFATSSVYDRSKIFAIFLGLYVAVFLFPMLVCLMADGTLGPGARWVAVLAPLWVWDAFILFYHSRVIVMGPIKRPDHVPEEEWVDPLPMRRRVTAMVRFVCLVLFQLLLALKLDGYVSLPWYAVFVPMYLWDLIALRRKAALVGMTIATHDELELAMGKKLGDCSPAEREEAHRRYIVVPSRSGPIYESARRLRDEAKMDATRILARVAFAVLLVLNLDVAGGDWSWWLVFLPIFAMAACVAMSAFWGFARAKAEAVARDPALFGMDPDGGVDRKEDGGEEADAGAGSSSSSTPYAKMEEGSRNGKEETSPLTDEERDELKARVGQSAYRALATCLSQCFLVVILCVLIGKVEGAGYSSMVIISPFLAAGGIVLCCLACTIFCISEVDENAGMEEFDTAVDRAAAAAAVAAGDAKDEGYSPPSPSRGEQQTSGVSGSESDAETATSSKPVPMATWDPERGEIWQNATIDVEDKDDVTDGDRETWREGDVELAATRKDEQEDARQRQPTAIETNPSITSVTSSQCDLD